MKLEAKCLGSIGVAAICPTKKNIERADKYTEQLLSDVGLSREGMVVAGIYGFAMRPYHKHFQ